MLQPQGFEQHYIQLDGIRMHYSHWVQQERLDEVNAAMLDFVKGLLS